MKAPLSSFFLINIKLDGPRLVDWCCFAHLLRKAVDWILTDRRSAVSSSNPPDSSSPHCPLDTITAGVLLFLFYFPSHPFSTRLYSSRMNVFQSKYCCTSSRKREGQTDKCVRTHWHMNKPDTHSHLYSCNRAEPLSSMWD